MSSKGGKMTQYINYRMRVTIQDGRMIVGTFLAFDKHMNLVIADADEIRITKNKGQDREEKRSLGLTLIRGETVIAMSIDGPPPVPKNKFREPPQLPGGPGKGTSSGRGITPSTFGPETGLGGPIKGVGGPSNNQMSQQTNLHMGRGNNPPGMMGGPPPGMMGRGNNPPGMIPPNLMGRGNNPPGMMGGPPPGMMGRGTPPGMMGGPPPGMMGGPPGMMGRGTPPGMMGQGMIGGPPPGLMQPPNLMGRGTPPGMMQPPPGLNPPGMMGRGRGN